MKIIFRQKSQQNDSINKSIYNPAEVRNDEQVQYALKIGATELLNESNKLEQIDFGFKLEITVFNTDTRIACSMSFNSLFNASGPDVPRLLNFQDTETVSELSKVYSSMLNNSIQIFDLSIKRTEGFEKLFVNRVYTPEDVKPVISKALFARGN